MKLQLTILLTFVCFGAFAQIHPEKKLFFESLTIDDGLSQGMINCMQQDKFGFMWFATKDGLNRYDGYQFVIYRHDVNDSSSLADNHTSYIYEDSKGRMWVGTAMQGLDLFDRATETFIHFKHNVKDVNSISGNHVLQIKEDQQGVLYVTTNGGISVLNEKKNKDGRSDFSFNTIDKTGACRVYPTDKGIIWIVPYDHPPYILTRKKDGALVKQQMPFANNAFNKTCKDSLTAIQSVIHDSINHVLYLIMEKSINKYDEKTGSLEKITGNEFSITYIPQQALFSAGKIWIPGDLQLLVFDVQKRQVVLITAEDPKQVQMLSSLLSFYQDKSGNIWIGTSGYGVLKYNDHAEKFHHTDNTSITWLQADNNGNVMVVKRGDAVWVFDKNSSSYIKKLPENATIARGKMFDGGIEAVLQDEDGTYWIAKQNFLHYDDTLKKFEYPAYEGVFCFPVYQDEGMVWMGAYHSFCCYNKKSKQFTYYPYPVKTDNTPYKFVEAIYRQNDSIFWLGTINGLLRFNKNSAEWEQFKNNPADTSSLSYNLIFSLCADPEQPDKYLWVGTNGGGLNRFDFATGKFSRYSTRDGLPNDVIYGILNDDRGNLWVSTNKGLSKFNPVTGSFHNFEKKDGLQSNEFNRYAYCKTTDGTLFFGGVNGFNYFKPGELSSNNVVPKIVITDFKVANNSVSINDNTGLLHKPVFLTDSISLQHEDNMISFDFAAMDFTQSDKNLYQYKLDGFDKDWIHAGSVHTATYTNLDPGTYTFQVKGSNSDEVWNGTGTSIRLIVLPPWYMTWWFRLVALAIVMTTLYFMYRYRLEQALKLQAIRNKIASDLHDEIGSNLSTISIFSDVAREASGGQPVSLILNKIGDYTQQSMEAMSDIVWMINARNDRFENIIIRMRELAGELIAAKHSILHLEIDERLNALKLGMQERKNFWLIYKEAMNNTVKYADAQNVWIKLNHSHGNVLLAIKDDGKGFDTFAARSGNGLLNMQERTAALKGKLSITSVPGAGTSVELIFKHY